MSDQLKPTGEWTADYVQAIADKANMSEQNQAIADAHNAALAAEREALECVKNIISDLQEQLQTLQDALRPFAALADTPDLQMKIQHEDLIRAKAVIAKVK